MALTVDVDMALEPESPILGPLSTTTSRVPDKPNLLRCLPLLPLLLLLRRSAGLTAPDNAPAQEELRKVAVPTPQYAQKEFASWVDTEQREGRGDFGEMGVEGPDSNSNAFLASLGMKGVGGMGHTRRAAGAHAPPPPGARFSVSSKHCCLEFPSGNAPREFLDFHVSSCYA